MKNDNFASIHDVFSDEDTVCNICIGLSNANPSTLCVTHFFEWADEKNAYELDRSTEDLYI
jgi:hypothetical protein